MRHGKPRSPNSDLRADAELMLEQHPNDFTIDDKKKIFASILHHSLISFDQSANRANFPLALRTISSLTPEQQSVAIRESDELLTKMATLILEHAAATPPQDEQPVLIKLGEVQRELQDCKDRIAELEAWKEQQVKV